MRLKIILIVLSAKRDKYFIAMKKFTKGALIMALLGMSIILSSWDWFDKAKQKVKEVTQEVLDGEKESAHDLIQAKLDTLQATVKIFNRRDISNQKFYEIANIHLRIAKELHTLTYWDETELRLFRKLTQGWCGGHPENKNWVSGFFRYNEALDYEFTDIVYPFDESNQLPTPLATSKTDDILDGLLK